MSFFHGANQVAILGGTHVATGPGNTVNINQGSKAGANNAFKDLSAAATHTALHNSAARFDAPRCHRNTRSKYRDQLELWMLGEDEALEGKRLIWLNGGAGAGKSAIMQSVVEQCAQHGVILGTFFFFRTDPSRNYAEVFIPTLAYQLARAFPQAMAVLEPIIQGDPFIFKASLQVQAYELLVRPLLHLTETGVIDNTGPLRRVFVVDGLDECHDAQKQALVIQAVASILCENHLPICFLIASRPEIAIGSAFQKEKRLRGIFATITLDEDDDAESDIRQFIEDSFLEILDTHPLRHLIKLPWPYPRSVNNLVWKSSGHFIYAATAMKFIASADEHPGRALKVVEGLLLSRTESPFAQLDALYLHILTSAKYSSPVLGILRHCYLTRFDNSVAAVCYVHGISPEDVELFLSDIQPLVSISPDSHTAEMRIHSKHASLKDFIQDEKRSQGIYISSEEYHTSLLMRYFQLLDNGPPAIQVSLYDGVSRCNTIIGELCAAIVNSKDASLLQVLIDQHSPEAIWNFCRESSAIDGENPETEIVRSENSFLLSYYTFAIRDSLANTDNSLYIRHFAKYIQLLVDDLHQLAQRKLRYRIIPALIFSSSPSGLLLVPALLVKLLGSQDRIAEHYSQIFFHLRGPAGAQIDPRSLEAIRRTPHSQLYWSSDLAIGMKFILRKLVDLSWTPHWACPNPHKKWLRKNKPLKQRSLGSPRLSSNFYSYLCRLENYDIYSEETLYRFRQRHNNHHRYVVDLVFKTHARRFGCILLLKAIISYLHKSNCIGDVVALARRLLPKAATAFPKLMKRVRAEMDMYVRRWEESSDGLLEKAYLLSINDMD